MNIRLINGITKPNEEGGPNQIIMKSNLNR